MDADELLPPEPGEAAREPEEPYDPRGFTAAELGVLREAMIKSAKMLEWRSGYPNLPAHQAQALKEAAQRRYDLAARLMRARQFVQQRAAVTGELAQALDRAHAASARHDAERRYPDE